MDNNTNKLIKVSKLLGITEEELVSNLARDNIKNIDSFLDTFLLHFEEGKDMIVARRTRIFSLQVPQFEGDDEPIKNLTKKEQYILNLLVHLKIRGLVIQIVDEDIIVSHKGSYGTFELRELIIPLSSLNTKEQIKDLVNVWLGDVIGRHIQRDTGECIITEMVKF